MGLVTQLKLLLLVLLGTLIGLAIFYNYSELSKQNVDFFACKNKANSLASNDLFLQKRLEVAETIWRRSIEARHLSRNSTNLKDPKSQLDYVIFWDYFYASFDCPFHVERIGRVGDGGKWVCGFQHLIRKPSRHINFDKQMTTAKNTNAKIKPSPIIYSFSYSIEISFEEEIAKRTIEEIPAAGKVLPCKIHLYCHYIDPTKNNNINTFLTKYNSSNHVKFHGLSIGSAKDPRSPKLLTLSSLMKQNGHDWIDILQIDIEGNEFDILKQIVTEFGVGKLPFGQLLLEIHLDSFVASRQDKFIEEFIVWFELLESAGLRTFHREANNIASIFGGSTFIKYMEFSFINVKNKRNPLLHA